MKEIHERTEDKFTIRLWLKNTTLVYNYCQRWQRFKSQIIKSAGDNTKQANALFSLWSQEKLK